MFNQSRTLFRASVLFAATLLTAAASAGAQSISGRVTDAATGQPLSGARVALSGTLQGVIARADGSYHLPVTAGTQIIRVSSIGYSPVVDTIVVGGEGASRDYKLVKGTVQLDANVVIGTRLNDRTVLNAAVPVDVLTPAEIQQTGQIETNQVIQMLAPSFNFPRPTISDGTDHIRPATLRGLGPDQVLVLVNGKRRYTTALVNVNGTIGRGSTGVDLNAIPSSSIERIEILRDGAAAQYGSDAIAGVINIILKTDPTTEIGAEMGQNYTTLHPNDTTYARNVARLPDTRLTDGDVAEWDANTGLNFRGGGFFHITGQYEHRGSTNRSLPDLRTQYLAGDPRNATYTGDNHFRQGDALVNDIGFMVNANLPQMSNGAQVYAFGGASHREGQSAGNWRQALNDNTVRSIYPDGFLPFINSTIGDYSGTVGVKGDLSRWKYDLSGSYGHNQFDFLITNTENATLGAASPTEFDSGGFRFGQAVANLDFVRAFPVSSFASPVNVAFGGEARHDAYGVRAGEPGSYQNGGAKVLDGPHAGAQPAPGAQVFPGFQPGDAGDHTRTNVAGYLDIETTPLAKLLIGLAGRSEHYSDFGNTTTGKASGRFEFYPGYAIRGAVQTGFRAPSLAQEFFSSTATNFLNINNTGLLPYEVRTLPPTSDVAVALGAEPLKAEKSVNYSVGLALAPLQNLSMTADYYHIKIDDRIVLSGNFGGTQGFKDFLASKGITGVGLARFFTNAIDTKTDGLDIITRYAVDFGNVGITRFTGAANWTKSHVTRISATPPALTSQSSVLFDRIEQGRIEVGQPHRTIHMTLDHTHNLFTATIHVAQFGPVGFRGTAANTTLDQTFHAKWVTDVNASYTLLRQLRFTVGANNVFDVYPDEQIPGNSNAGIFPYSNTLTTFGFNGRFIYAKAKFTP
ncbi:MAG: TonB-dependent receptor domain-containing protein [Gemmatimonadaceae bacterium]